MANPAIIECNKDTWSLVASGVTAGSIYNMSPTVSFMQTYRMAGQSAPSDGDDAVFAFIDPFAPLAISAPAAIDIYLMPIGADGSVRVDV